MFGLGFLFYYAHIKIKNKGFNIPRVCVYFSFRVLIRLYKNHVKNGGLCRRKTLDRRKECVRLFLPKATKKPPRGVGSWLFSAFTTHSAEALVKSTVE